MTLDKGFFVCNFFFGATDEIFLVVITKILNVHFVFSLAALRIKIADERKCCTKESWLSCKF